MKKLIFIFLLPLVVLTACETTTSDNGDLDAMWYLVKVDSLNGGSSVDYRDKRIMWSFQGSLLQMNRTERFIKYYMAHFTKENGCMKITSPFYSDRVNGDVILTEERIDEIRQFGLNSLDESFRIETLNDKKMILEDNVLRLTFERY